MKNRTAYHALRFTLTLAALAGLAGSGSGTDMYWVGYQGCAEGAQEASFWNGDNWFGYVVPDSLDAAIFDPNYDPQDNGMPHVIHFGSFCVDQFSCPNPTHTPAKVDTVRQLRIPDGSFIFDFGSGGDGCTPPNSDSGGLNIEWGLHLGLDNPG